MAVMGQDISAGQGLWQSWGRTLVHVKGCGSHGAGH